MPQTVRLALKQARLPLLLLVIAIKVAAVALLCRQGLVLLSSDDVTRTIYTWRWLESGGIIPHDYWLPLFFYVYGAAFKLLFNFLLTAKIVSLTLSLLLLLAVYRLTQKLSENNRTASLAVLLVLALPIYHWLSLSPLSEMLFAVLYLLSLLAFLNWQSRRSLTGACWLSISLLLPMLVRYEGWVLSGFLFLLCVIIFIKHKPSQNWSVKQLLVLAAPFGFCAFWLLRWVYFYGDPLFIFRDVYQSESAQFLQRSGYFWNPLKILSGQNIVLAGGFLLWLFYFKRRLQHKFVSAAVLGSVLLVSCLPWLIKPATVFPQRMLFLPLVLLCPLAAIGFAGLWARRKQLAKVGPVLVVIAAFCVAAVNLGSYTQDGLSAGAMSVGKLIRSYYRQGRLTQQQAVALEAQEKGPHRYEWQQILIVSGNNKKIGLAVLAAQGLKWKKPIADYDQLRLIVCRTSETCRRMEHAPRLDQVMQVDDYLLIMRDLK